MFFNKLFFKFIGPKGFADIRTVDKVTNDTFREAAISKGLLENDEEWSPCLQEAFTVGSPHNIRVLFATFWYFQIQLILRNYKTIIKVYD